MLKKILLIAICSSILNANNVVENYLKELKVEAKKDNSNFTSFSYERGEEIFTSEHIGKRGKKISCVSCHSVNLSLPAKNFFTGKVIEPLSPKVNKKRFTKLKTIKKWLRRNFKDVYKRVGTAQEKGDVLVYIINK